MSVKSCLSLVALSLAAGSALANNALYTGLGTDGFTVGYARSLDPHNGLRIELNTLKYDGNFNTSDVRYKADLKLNTVSALYDFFPFGGGFRISAGAVIGDRKLDYEASNVTINGTTYSAPGERLYGTAALPNVSPYLGIGYGHQARSAGFGFFADLGVVHGSADISLKATPGLGVSAADLETERAKIQKEADKYEWYPIVKLGLSYAF